MCTFLKKTMRSGLLHNHLIDTQLEGQNLWWFIKTYIVPIAKFYAWIHLVLNYSKKVEQTVFKMQCNEISSNFQPKQFFIFLLKECTFLCQLIFFSCLSSCKSSIKWNFPFALFYSNVYLPLYCNERSWFFYICIVLILLKTH